MVTIYSWKPFEKRKRKKNILVGTSKAAIQVNSNALLQPLDSLISKSSSPSNLSLGTQNTKPYLRGDTNNKDGDMA